MVHGQRVYRVRDFDENDVEELLKKLRMKSLIARSADRIVLERRLLVLGRKMGECC